LSPADSPPADEIISTLVAAGRTRQQLERHVSIGRQRKEAADVLAEQTPEDEELRTKQAARAAAYARLQEAKKEYDAAIAEPLARLDTIRHEVQAIFDANDCRSLLHSLQYKQANARTTLNQTRSKKAVDQQIESID